MNSVQLSNSVKLWWLRLMYCSPPWQKASSERELVDSEQLWHTDTRLLISMCRQHQRRASKVILTELYLTWAKGYSLFEALYLTRCVSVGWKVCPSEATALSPKGLTSRKVSHVAKCIILDSSQMHKPLPQMSDVQKWKQTHRLVLLMKQEKSLLSCTGKINRALPTKNSIFAAH